MSFIFFLWLLCKGFLPYCLFCHIIFVNFHFFFLATLLYIFWFWFWQLFTHRFILLLLLQKNCTRVSSTVNFLYFLIDFKLNNIFFFNFLWLDNVRNDVYDIYIVELNYLILCSFFLFFVFLSNKIAYWIHSISLV